MEFEDDWSSFQPDILKRGMGHADRTPFVRPVRYELGRPYDGLGIEMRTALSINFSAGGLCMLTDGARLLVPQTLLYLSGVSADGNGHAMALGEVRWVRRLPRRFQDPCLVGLKVHPWIPGGA
jgi:hypothetical protein